MRKSKIEKPREITIKEKVSFHFAYEENAKNVAVALSLGGYYIKIGKFDGKYTVDVYTDR